MSRRLRRGRIVRNPVRAKKPVAKKPLVKPRAKNIDYIDPNVYFDKIYCLNLKRRPDRWAESENTFRYSGIHADRFDATDGQTNSVQSKYKELLKQTNKYDKLLGRKAIASEGALGCLLSVVRIIKDAKKNGFKRILLLDDDVIISKDFHINFSNVNLLPKDWKLLYLGASQHTWLKIKSFNNDFYFAKNTSGTFAVGIDSSVYDEIIKSAEKLEVPIDACLINNIQTKYYKKCFVFKDNLIIAKLDDSDIRGGRSPEALSEKFKWNLNNYILAKKMPENLALGITTYNRIDYLKKIISTFYRTKNPFFKWTLIIADDGSTDGSVEYIKSLRLPGVKVVKIYSDRIGVHVQTNKIFNAMLKSDADFFFKADDDIYFERSGWDSLYLRAAIKSKFSHLCYFNKKWKKPKINIIKKPREISSSAGVKDALGCFWTFDRAVLRKVGYIDCELFGYRGQGHLDFSARCCRAGFNSSRNFFDALNSEYYIEMHQRGSYVGTLDKSHAAKLSRSSAEKKRKLSIINSNRIYIGDKK